MEHVTFKHESGMFVRVVAASRNDMTGDRVATLHLRYPRFLHSEIMTHRVLNRNARSSRAVPVKTMLDEIRNDPVIPWHWTKNQPGMQGEKGHDALVEIGDDLYDSLSNEQAWLSARDAAVNHAEAFAKAGYHKQIVNRIVETFMWIDTLISATDWANFLHLRDHDAAEPHIRDLAALVRQALDWCEENAVDLRSGEWHLPYITKADVEWAKGDTEVLCKISAARCARISYTPFDGNPSYERELERYRLLTGGDAIHASPLEHQCSPDKPATVETTYWDDLQNPSMMMRDVSTEGHLHPELHGPLRGFIQFRKLVPNEAVHG